MSGLAPLRFGQVELGDGRVAVISVHVGVALVELRVWSPDHEEGWRQTGERMLLPLEAAADVADTIGRVTLAPEALVVAPTHDLRGRA